MSMKSRNLSSISEAPSSKVPKRWEALLDSREWLTEARALYKTPLWDCLREQLEAERFLYLEALADTDDDTERVQFSAIAKWIKRLLDDLPAEVLGRFDHLKEEDAGLHEKPDLADGGTYYMEPDGDSEPEENV